MNEIENEIDRRKEALCKMLPKIQAPTFPRGIFKIGKREYLVLTDAEAAGLEGDIRGTCEEFSGKGCFGAHPDHMFDQMTRPELLASHDKIEHRIGDYFVYRTK